MSKKLALIYSGQPRHLRECYENHRSNFYQPGWDVDVFAHIWYDESWVGSYFWDQYKDRGKWDAELIPFMEEKWQPIGGFACCYDGFGVHTCTTSRAGGGRVGWMGRQRECGKSV